MNAADIIVRMEGDVKVVRIRETRFKECASREMPPGIQLTQLDMPGMEAQEMASQIQAMEAVRQVERGGGESEEGKNRCWEVPEEMLSDGEPEQRGQQHQGPEVGDTDEDCVILILFRTCLQGNSEGSRKAERQRDHRGRTQWSDGNTHASCRDRLERTRRDSENEHSKSGTRSLQDVLKKRKKTMKAEENRSAAGFMRESRPDNRLKLRRDDSEFTAFEFDSTLGYPGEGPPRVADFGAIERCGSCDLAPWRVYHL